MRPFALSLIALTLVTGCAVTPATLAPARQAPAAAHQAPVAPVLPARPAPVEPLLPVQPVAPALPAPAERSTITVSGVAAMSEEEIAEDTDAGAFGLLAKPEDEGRPFSKTGIVRRAESGYVLQASNGLLRLKKKTTLYPLAVEPGLMDELESRVDRKALLRGTIDRQGLVTVTSVKGLANLGFLFNWFSKGRIEGLVQDTAGQPVGGVKFIARAEGGYLLTTLSDAQGTFTLSGVTPGSYTVSLEAAGYEKAEPVTVTVAKRESASLSVRLVPLPTPSPSPTATTPPNSNSNADH